MRRSAAVAEKKRPADAIGLAVTIGTIATGEFEDGAKEDKSAIAQFSSLGGHKRAEIT